MRCLIIADLLAAAEALVAARNAKLLFYLVNKLLLTILVVPMQGR
jgi:hypothetical protein